MALKQTSARLITRPKPFKRKVTAPVVMPKRNPEVSHKPSAGVKPALVKREESVEPAKLSPEIESVLAEPEEMDDPIRVFVSAMNGDEGSELDMSPGLGVQDDYDPVVMLLEGVSRGLVHRPRDISDIHRFERASEDGMLPFTVPEAIILAR